MFVSNGIQLELFFLSFSFLHIWLNYLKANQVGEMIQSEINHITGILLLFTARILLLKWFYDWEMKSI